MSAGHDLVVAVSAPQAMEAERFGPKAANLAALGAAGLPIPDGFCLDAAAYRLQLRALGLEQAVRAAVSSEPAEARRLTAEIRIGLFEGPIAAAILDPLLEARRELVRRSGALPVVRSSALIEDRAGSTFAGQFESFLGLETETDFVTAVRACWAALWASRATRYMTSHDLSPGDTAMALLIQPLVSARASGGGLSRSGDDEMLLSATWGLGSAIAQGEVVPDRILLRRDGSVARIDAGRKEHQVGCVHHQGPSSRAVPKGEVCKPCLDEDEVLALGRLLLAAEKVLGMPAEIEWALDAAGFRLLQVRPLNVQPATVPDEIWLRHPGLNGHPAGIGWGQGRACVVNCECEISRVGPGDVLVTKVAGPALSHVLPRVAGVVAELGGSTSHLASLARERGIPMVLGVLDATRQIPDGVQVAVDGVAGVVRWIR